MTTSAGIATFIRIGFARDADDIYTPRGNFLYTSRKIAILSTAELGIGITTACAATLRPLFEQWFGHKLKPRSVLRTIGGDYVDSWDTAYEQSQTSKRDRKLSKKRISWIKTKSTVTGFETLVEMPELVFLDDSHLGTQETDLEKGGALMLVEQRRCSVATEVERQDIEDKEPEEEQEEYANSDRG